MVADYIRTAYAGGGTLHSIGRELGLSAAQIRYRMQLANIGRRPCGNRKSEKPASKADERLSKAAPRWKEMQAMRDNGRYLWQIAEAFGVTVSTVAKCLLKLQSAKLDKKL